MTRDGEEDTSHLWPYYGDEYVRAEAERLFRRRRPRRLRRAVALVACAVIIRTTLLALSAIGLYLLATGRTLHVRLP